MVTDDRSPGRPLAQPPVRLSVLRRDVPNGVSLSVIGELDLRTVPLLRAALLKALAEHQPAVLVD